MPPKNQPKPTWNEAKVKAALPEVEVLVRPGVVAVGITSGRLLDHCVVWVYSHMNSHIPFNLPAFRREYSWKAVVDSLNKKKPLSI